MDIAVEELIDNVVKTFRMNDYIEEKYLDEDEITDRKESLNTMKKFVKNNNLEQFINFVYGSKPSKKKNENLYSSKNILQWPIWLRYRLSLGLVTPT